MNMINLKTGMESSLLNRVKQYLEENGIFKTFCWVMTKSLKRILFAVYRAVDYNLAVTCLDRVTTYKTINKKHLHCKELEMQDLGAIEKGFGKTVSKTFAKRMQTSMGYLIFDQNEIAGYAWCCHHLIKNEGIRPFLVDLQPKKDTIYMYDFFIRPEKRNKNALTLLLNYILFQLKMAGFKIAFFISDKRNLAMKSVASKLGFEIDGQISCRRYIGIIVKKTSALEKVCEFVK